MGFFSTAVLDSQGGAKCDACKLYKQARSPKLPPWGNCNAGLFILGEAPGRVEDKKGKPWQGDAGRELKLTLHEFGFSLFDDAVSLNSVNCRPPKNRTPTEREISYCRPYVWKNIRAYKPKVILGLGTPAVQSLLGHRWKKDLKGVMRWRGLPIPDRDLNAWLIFSIHPSAVIRQGTPDWELYFSHDLKTALRLLDTPVPKFVPESKCIDYLEGSRRKEFLRNLADGKWGVVAFDYETTGLKPHAEGHQIVCCSVATSPVHVAVFMFDLSDEELKYFQKFLKNEKILKIAHNMKFETTWSEVRAGARAVGWLCDTMLLAHVYDNRDSFTSLKFQTAIWFGLFDYDSKVSHYLEATEDGANAFNRIHQLLQHPSGKFTLLTYCAYDSLLEYRLAVVLSKLTGLRHIYNKLDKTSFCSIEYPPDFFRETYLL